MRTTSGRILNLLKQNPLITRERISVEIGISDRMVAKYLKDFQEKGVLERVGGKFGGQWVINDNETKDVQSGPEGRVETDLKNSNTNLKTDLKITKTDLKSGPVNTESREKSGPENLKSGPETDQKGGPETPKVDCKSDKSGPENTPGKILELIRQDRYITSREIAVKLGMARSGISKHLRNLQENGVLRHIGFNKGGYWEVIG